MGCSTSSQTSAVDTTRPSAKPEESNGASTTGDAQSFICNAYVSEICGNIQITYVCYTVYADRLHSLQAHFKWPNTEYYNNNMI